VCLLQATDNRQKLWYVFDNTLVLPEYLVEYRYDVNSTSVLKTKKPSDDVDVTSASNHVLDRVEFDVRSVFTMLRFAEFLIRLLDNPDSCCMVF
jgi:hypothetical protein